MKHWRPLAYRLLFPPARSFSSRTKDQNGNGLSHPDFHPDFTAFCFQWICEGFLKQWYWDLHSWRMPWRYAGRGRIAVWRRKLHYSTHTTVQQIQPSEARIYCIKKKPSFRYVLRVLFFHFVLCCVVLCCFVLFFFLKRAIRKLAFTGKLGRAQLEE